MGNSPGLLFWLLALFTIVPATLAVTSKKAVNAIVALGILILGVAIILAHFGAALLGLTHLLLFGIAAIATLLVLRIRSRVADLSAALKSGRPVVVYLILAAIFFLAPLFLIANTNIWQYVQDGNQVSFANLLSSLFGQYLLPFVLVMVALLVMLVMAVALIKRRAL